MRFNPALFAAALFALLFFFAVIPTQAAMVLEWKFNETNGSPTVADSSGNGNIGLVTNATFVPTGGIIGGCAQFAGASGVDQRIYMNTNTGTFPAALETAPYQYPITVSLWAKNNTSGSLQLFSLGVNNGSIYHACRELGFMDERANGLDNLIGTGAISGTSWNHIVCVYSATNSQAIYVNGVLNASGTVYGVTNKLVQFAAGSLYRAIGSTPANPYAGQMEDVTVWTDVLTAQQVAAIYGLGHFSAGYAGDSANFLAAFTAGTNITLHGITWARTTGLPGAVGSVGGNVATLNAYVVLDSSGDGMEVVAAPVPPTVLSFIISPSQVFAGDTVLLGWNVAGASSVTINQGIGSVPSAGTNFFPTAVSSNASSITWTLVATNLYGSTTNFATLTILPTPAPLKLVVHWSLDESNGTTATNSLGSYATGQFVVLNNISNGVSVPAIPPAWEPTNGYIGGDLSFTTALTTNNAVVRSDLGGVVLTNYPFVLAAWVNTQDVVTRNETVISLVNSNASDQYYCLQVDAGQARLAARNGSELDLYGGYVYGSGNYADWHYIVADFERDSLRNIYVDGSLITTDTNAIGGFIPVDRFSAGAIDRQSGISAPYTGRADELALFTGTLTADEVHLFYGGMSGLGLNTAQIEALRDAFLQTNSATVDGVAWVYVPALGGTGNEGSTSGSIAAQNAAFIMDTNGNGMEISTSIPGITGISPSSPVTGSSGSQTLTINGVNFQSGCQVVLSNLDTSAWVNQAATFNSSSDLTVSATFTVTAHNWSVQVVNPGGTTSAAFDFAVAAPPRPKIGSISFASGKTQVVLTGTNGTAGLTYTVLSSTNLTLPLASWTPLTTSVFGAGGAFNCTNTVGNNPRSFFIIEP